MKKIEQVNIDKINRRVTSEGVITSRKSEK